MPSPHMDDEKGKKTMEYKARKDRRKGDGRKKRRKKKENKIFRVCPKRIYCYILFSYLGSFLHKNPIFWPRISLAFFPALYKFIVWATWTWIHSRFGFKSNLVLTIGAVCGKLVDLIRKRFGFSAQNGGIRFASTNGRATSGQ